MTLLSIRRPLTTVALAMSAVALIAGLSASPVGAQASGCAGDRVSAAMSSEAASGPAWSVTDACVAAGDYFTGEYEGHTFAIGISNVTYDDGHVGRLAFLSLRIDAEQAVTVVAMEGPTGDQIRLAGTVRQAALSESGVTVAGSGIAFPPLESATVSLDFTDTAAPWPDWATGVTTTTTAGASTTTVPTTVPASTSTTVPAVTSTVPTVTTLPSIPGVDVTTTTLLTP